MSTGEPFSLSSAKTARACAAATGFDFRLGATPTTAQLRQMCGQDDCIQQVNLSLMRARNSPSRTELELRQLREFAYVVVDFCYYYRKPDQPCPNDFLTQFKTDFKDLVSACEAKSGVSLKAGTNGTGADVTDLCDIDECDNVMRRLYVKQMIRTCEPMSGVSSPKWDAYKALMDTWVYPYKATCPVANSPTWYLSTAYFSSIESVKYVYLPGPLPAEPTTFPPPTDTPNPTPSPTPSPTSPTPSVELAISAASSDASGSDGSASSQLSESMFVVPQVTPKPNVDVAVPAPTLQSETSNSDGALLLAVVLCGAAIVAMLVAFVFYRHRQRRRESVNVKADDDYEYSSITNVIPMASTIDSSLRTCQELPVTQLEDVRIIGGGGSGIVYLVRDTGNDNRLLASKRINRNNATDDQADAFVAEIALAASLSHPRIVQFVAIAGLHKSDLQGLFEYMPGGDLCRYLSLLPPVDPARHSWTAQKLQIAIDVADALTYIHTLTPKPVIHRDLKSRNVMLSSDHRAKLGDFGVSRTESAVASMTTGVGTTRWVAPEVILGGGDYSTACDIYSFGVVMTELDTQRLPFSELVNSNGDQLADFVVMELVATQRQQPALSGTCPSAIRDLTRRCLSFEPSDRPTADEVASTLRRVQR